MINPFYTKLAELAINYSLDIKKGDRVVVEGPVFAQELFQALYAEIIKAGGFPLLQPSIEGELELLFKYGTEEQIGFVDDVVLQIFEDFDGLVQIFGDYNTRNLSLIEPAKMTKFQAAPKRKKILDLVMERYAKGEVKWVIIPFPCQSHAQEANMDLFSFTNFIEKALLLDRDDPVKEWSEIHKKQEKVVNYLNKIEMIKVIGEDTNLEFSVKGRKWDNCSGQTNLPDGEICTCPVENSVNGKIRFTYPGIYNSREVENIYLEFNDGKVIKSTAEKGEQILEEVLKVENANILGEFAIGTNYGITTFIKNMLFDEKMGGTIHCALGAGFPELGSKNDSAIHWDILKDMRSPGSQIFADDEVIYEEGKWKI